MKIQIDFNSIANIRKRKYFKVVKNTNQIGSKGI